MPSRTLVSMRVINSRRQRVGHLGQHPLKHDCRVLLTSAATRVFPEDDCIIFTFAGIDADCVRLLRTAFPMSRIVSIERDEIVARYTPDVQLRFENYLINFNAYVSRRHQPFRLTAGKRRTRVRVEAFDYPIYDIAFLDFTGLPTDELLHDSVRFINEQMGDKFVVGLTFKAKSSQSRMALQHLLEDGLLSQLTKPYVVARWMRYRTNTEMEFLLLTSPPAGRRCRRTAGAVV